MNALAHEPCSKREARATRNQLRFQAGEDQAVDHSQLPSSFFTRDIVRMELA